MISLAEYIADAKSQLCCNRTDRELELYISYEYTNEEVDANRDYFDKCRKKGLSAYKALLFLEDYLKGEMSV